MLSVRRDEMPKDSKLDRAVKQQLDRALSERLAERNRQANARAVKELVGVNPDEPGWNKGGFAAACKEATAGLRDREFARARYELRRNPSVCFDTAAEQEFRESYPNTPDEWLTSEIELVRRSMPLGR
jgi:hypothetical protein